MPSPLEHLSIAMAVKDALPIDYPGAFFAGVVAPDVDKLLGFPRAATHWWHVGNDLSGAIRLCSSRPKLVHLPDRSEVQTFVAGYLCHLVTDEQWTLCIYRKYFGRHSTFGGSRHGADHQLALQSGLDTELITTGHLRPAVCALEAQGPVSHLARVVLDDHASAVDRFVQSVLARANEANPRVRLRIMAEARGYERLRTSDSRVAVAPLVLRTTDDSSVLNSFVDRLPQLRDAALRLVPIQEVRAFRERAIDVCIEVAGQFLRGDPITPPLGTASAPYFASPARTDL